MRRRIIPILLVLAAAAGALAQRPTAIRTTVDPDGFDCTAASAPVVFYDDGSSVAVFYCDSGTSQYVEHELQTAISTFADLQAAVADKTLVAEENAATFDAAVSAKNLNGEKVLQLYATSGAGTSGDPWVVDATAWNSVKGGRVRAAPGYYQVAHGAKLDVSDGTQLRCDAGAILTLPGTQRTTEDPMFLIANDADVVIEGCEFYAGMSISESTTCQTGTDTASGTNYLKIGDVSAGAGDGRVVIRNNRFRPTRRASGASSGNHIQIDQGLHDSIIENNWFDLSKRAIYARSAHATVDGTYSNVFIVGNIWNHDDYEPYAPGCGKTGDQVSFNNGAGGATAWSFSNVHISRNRVDNVDTFVRFTVDGEGFYFQDNVHQGQNQDFWLWFIPPTGATRVYFTGNVAQDTSAGGADADHEAQGSEVHFQNADHVEIVGNSWFSLGTDYVVNLYNADDVLIRGNTFDTRQDVKDGTTANQDGIDLYGVDGALILDNVCVDCRSLAEFDGASTDVIIRNAVLRYDATDKTSNDYVLENSANCTSGCILENVWYLGDDALTGIMADESGFDRIDRVYAASDFSVSSGTVLEGATIQRASDPWHTAPDFGTFASWPSSGAIPQYDAAAGGYVSPAVGTLSAYAIHEGTSYTYGADDDNSGSASNPNNANDAALDSFAEFACSNGSTVTHDWMFTGGAAVTGRVQVVYSVNNTKCDASGGTTTSVLICTTGGTCTPATTVDSVTGSTGGTLTDATWTPGDPYRIAEAELSAVDPANVVVRVSFTTQASGNCGPGGCRPYIHSVRIVEGGDWVAKPSGDAGGYIDASGNAAARVAFPVFPGTSGADYGVAVWADGSGAAWDTGNEVCGYLGLTCADAWFDTDTDGEIEDSDCTTTHGGRHLVFCHE